MKRVFLQITAILLLAAVVQCKDKPATNSKTSNHSDSADKEYLVPQKGDFTYAAFVMKGNDSLVRNFRKELTGAKLKTILTLNRVDENNFTDKDTLVVPDKFDDNLLAYSPFPYQLPVFKEVKKIAIFSYPIQAFGLYENGNLVKWGATSMGSKKHPTPTGLYFTNWKGEETISTQDDEWILRWNFNVQNEKGIAWHQYSLPGYPASHSCMRLLESDAKWMYEWAKQWVLDETGNEPIAKGTPVIVYGSYTFGGRSPWLALLNDPKANDISEQELTQIVQPHVEEILKEQSHSEQIRKQKEAEKTASKKA